MSANARTTENQISISFEAELKPESYTGGVALADGAGDLT
jgi:hypothetical protein